MDIPAGGGGGDDRDPGGRFGGYGLYLLQGKPVFLYNLLSLSRFRWQGERGAGGRQARRRVRLPYDGPGPGKGGTGILKVDGVEVASRTIPHTMPFLITIDETFDIGEDTRTPVDDHDYQVPFRFTGKIDKLTVVSVGCNWPRTTSRRCTGACWPQRTEVRRQRARAASLRRARRGPMDPSGRRACLHRQGGVRAMDQADQDQLRLLTGAGAFTDDRAPRDALHAVFVRSTRAHARIRVDPGPAAAVADVVRIVTGADCHTAGLRTFPAGFAPQRPGGPQLVRPFRPALALDRVRFAGEPIACVVAESLAAAQDGAEAVGWNTRTCRR